MKLKSIYSYLICLHFFLLASVTSYSQDSNFEKGRLSFYLPADKLFTIYNPIIGAGIEIKSGNNFSVAFDTGIGFHPFELTVQKEVTTSKWRIYQGQVLLKYFFKRKYSKWRLKRWRDNIEKSEDQSTSNFKYKKFFWGLSFRAQTEQNQIAAGSFIDPLSSPIFRLGTNTSYQTAFVIRDRFQVGIMRGFRVNFGDSKSYYELGLTAGFIRTNTEFYNAVDQNYSIIPLRIFPPFSSATNSIFIPVYDFTQRGVLVEPFVKINFVVGF